jgi:hypothetical protein
MKRKQQQPKAYVPAKYDECQTPRYGVWPILDYTPKSWTIWEPAAGEGYMADAMRDQGYTVYASELQERYRNDNIAAPMDFFKHQIYLYDCIITNPPFSIKYDWIARCYELKKPWALLLPVEVLGAKTAQTMFAEYGVQVILLNTRIDFKMPYKGWDGGGAQFPVAWFTHGFDLPRDLMYDKNVGLNKKLDRLERK